MSMHDLMIEDVHPDLIAGIGGGGMWMAYTGHEPRVWPDPSILFQIVHSPDLKRGGMLFVFKHQRTTTPFWTDAATPMGLLLQYIEEHPTK